MRDPRLIDAWALAAEARRREATDLYLAAVAATDRNEVDSLLSLWWSEVLAHDPRGEQWRNDQLERLQTMCSSLSSGPRMLALAALSALGRGTTDVAQNAGARILGASAAAVVRRATGAVELDRAVRLLTDCWEAVNVLQEILLQEPAWPPSTDVLSVASAPIDDLLAPHYDRVPTSLLIEEEREARERGISGYFWGHYRELPLNETSIVRLTLMARRDWGDVAIQADALPLRALRDWLWLTLDLDEDRESILALLRAAPPVFANDAWTGSTSALAALRASVRHPEKLQARLSQATRAYAPASDAEAKLKSLEDDELPRWLRKVADVTLERSDGRVLLVLFASKLLREDLSPPSSGQRSWRASHHALRAINQALAPKPSLAECQQVARMGGIASNRSTIDHATCLITSAAFGADSKQVWAWYRELLLKNDDDLCWQARSCHRRALCYNALAERLGQLADPLGEWRWVWKSLFVTDREAARFAPDRRNALYPSLHLVRVGIEFLRQAPSRNCAWNFFQELLAHTHALVSNEAGVFCPPPPEIALEAMDVGPRIPGAAWAAELAGYRHLLLSARNRVYVAALLLEGGASFPEAQAAVEDAPRRLMDSVAELRSSGEALTAYHLCELIASAAEQHAACLERTP